MKYLVHTQVVIIFILVVLGILCIYLLYLFIDSKRRPVELSVTADEVTKFNVIKYILHYFIVEFNTLFKSRQYIKEHL